MRRCRAWERRPAQADAPQCARARHILASRQASSTFRTTIPRSAGMQSVLSRDSRSCLARDGDNSSVPPSSVDDGKPHLAQRIAPASLSARFAIRRAGPSRIARASALLTPVSDLPASRGTLSPDHDGRPGSAPARAHARAGRTLDPEGANSAGSRPSRSERGIEGGGGEQVTYRQHRCVVAERNQAEHAICPGVGTSRPEDANGVRAMKRAGAQLDDHSNRKRDEREPVAACKSRRVHGATNQRRIASSAVAHIA